MSHADKVVLLLNKTTNLFWKLNLKFFIFLKITLACLIAGCSFAPMQKEGSDALIEAHCLYEKKIDFESTDFEKCLRGKFQ